MGRSAATGFIGRLRRFVGPASARAMASPYGTRGGAASGVGPMPRRSVGQRRVADRASAISPASAAARRIRTVVIMNGFPQRRRGMGRVASASIPTWRATRWSMAASNTRRHSAGAGAGSAPIGTAAGANRGGRKRWLTDGWSPPIHRLLADRFPGSRRKGTARRSPPIAADNWRTTGGQLADNWRTSRATCVAHHRSQPAAAPH